MPRAASASARVVQWSTPLVVGVLSVLASAEGCTGSHPAPAAVGGTTSVTTPAPVRVRKPAVDPRAPARAHVIATINHRAIGPFMARTAEAGIVAWITSPPRGPGQELDVVALDPEGAPLTPPTVAATMADSPDGITSLVVRPSGSARGGWLVAWSALMDRGEALMVLALDDHAQPRSQPVEIERTADHLAWFDFVPALSGAVCVWAEETAMGSANLVAVAVDYQGKAKGLPARVARGVARWDIAPSPTGAPGAPNALSAGEGLALVDVPDGAKAESGPGTLLWEILDGQGRPRLPEVPILTVPGVSSDVDAVTTARGWLLGWTDRTAPDAQVTLARVDANGRVAGPTKPLISAGSSALVALASGAAGALLAWQTPRAGAYPERSLHLVQMGPDATVTTPQRAITLDVASHATPEIVATDSGFALLVVAHACLASTSSAPPVPCTGPLAPMLVRLTATLDPVQTEPILLGDDDTPAALAWGLACSRGRCSALAADGATPTTVSVVDFPQRPTVFAAPMVPPLPADAARTTGVETIATGQVFSDVVATRMGDDVLLATMAPPDDPDTEADVHARPRAPSALGGATITVYPLDATGHPLGTPTTVSARAIANGGLAIASALRPEEGAAMVWVKRDGGDPQVHVAHLNRRGKRLREVQLTTEKGDAASVAVVAIEGGWLVAWVDGRGQGGEVYAARIDSKLDRVSHEVRVTNAAGDASDVTLAAIPGDPSRVWLAWSDSRDSPSEGLGDIYIAQLRTQDASRLGDEVRLLATEHHSRSPSVVAWPAGPEGGGALIGWLEEGPPGLDSLATVMLARVDSSGHRVGDATKLSLPAGSNPTGITLTLDDGARRLARAVVPRSVGGAVSLEALHIRGDGREVGSRSSLLDLEAGPPFEVSVALAGDAIFFDDAAATAAEHRIRRAAVDWRRVALVP